MIRFISASALLLVAILASGCFFNVTSYKDTDGSTVYVGELRNDGPPLSNPFVTGTFYDANGNVIATEDGFACTVLNSGTISAFKVRLPAGTAQPARVEWKLDGNPVDNAYLAEGLTGRLTSTGPGLPPANITSNYGEMTNHSQNTYSGGSGCVAWTNARGEVIRVADIDAAGLRFGPGDTLPFVARENVPADAVDALFFLDAGVRPAGSPPFRFVDIPLSAFRNTSTVLNGAAPFGFGFGEVHNSGSDAVLPSIAVTTRDASGTINGVGNSSGFCNVPAPPGGFTYSGYGFTSAAAPGTKPTIKIEGSVFDASTVEFATVSNVHQSSPSGGLSTVTGTVKNPGTKTLSFVRVCAAAYNDAGDVISVGAGFADIGDNGLGPNQSAQFSVELPLFEDAASVEGVAAGGE